MNNTTITPSTQEKEQFLKMYIYGSRQVDQYYNPKFNSLSKRPICLTDIQKFKQDQDDDDSAQTLVRNPLFKANIFKLVCGSLHTVVITSQGQAYTFGCSDSGAIGRQGRQDIPLKVDLPQPVNLISAGDNHTVFANSQTGSIYFTGTYFYKTGQNISKQQPIKKPIVSYIQNIDYRLKNKQIQKVVSGSNHTAILVDGKVYVRGDPQTHTIARKTITRNKIKNSLTFQGVGLHDVEDLWSGGYHNLAKIKHKQQLSYYVWGLNSYGQLGLGNYEQYQTAQQNKYLKDKNIIDASGGTHFMIILTDQGQLYGCGQNSQGQLGLGQDFVYESSEDQQQQKEEQANKAQNPEQLEKVENVSLQRQKKQIQAGIENKMNLSQQQEKVQAKNQQSVQQGQLPKTLEEKLVFQHKIIQEKDAIPLPPPQVSQIKPQVQSQVKPQESNNKIEEPQEKKADIFHADELSMKRDENTSVKKYRKINIPQKIDRIIAGQNSCYGWNKKNLYTWGLGECYVLLNGIEEEQYEPFQVRQKIINNQAIHDVAPASQHVAYLAYPSGQPQVQPKLSQKTEQLMMSAKQSLKKKRRR